MKTEIKTQPKSRVKLTVSLDKDELAKYFDEAYEELAPSVTIKGFRAGKAPKDLIVASIGDVKLSQKALDKALQDSYIKALEKEKLVSVGPPAISIKEQGEGLEYEAEVDVWPVVTIGEYKNLKVKAPKADEVKDDEVDQVVEYLRRQRAKISDVSREAKVGDRVEIDFTGSIDHVIKEKLTSKNHPVIIGDGALIPGFEDHLVGMKKAEDKTFDLVFPKDSPEKEFAGKKISFKVKMHNVQEVIIPEMTDEMAGEMGAETVADLRKSIKESIEREKQAKHRQEVEQMVVEKALSVAKADIPDALVEQELDRVMHNLEHEAKNYGMTLEQYLLKMKKTHEELRKEWREQAEKNVKIGLMLGEIAKKEELDINDKEVARNTVDKLVEYMTS